MSAFLERLHDIAAFAIIRAASAPAAVETGLALARGGLRAIEVTFTTPGATLALAELHRALPDVLLGAGTVLDPETLDAALGAGAEFVVSPHFDPALVAAAQARGVPYLPGALTPTEVLAAHRAGAAAIKLFPAAELGPGHLRALRGPFPDLSFVPTGGIDASNVADWFAAGATAVGVGGALVRGHGAEIEENARQLLAAVAAARGARRGA